MYFAVELTSSPFHGPISKGPEKHCIQMRTEELISFGKECRTVINKITNDLIGLRNMTLTRLSSS